MRNYPFNQFKYGLVSKLPIQELPDGAAYDSLNWLTLNGQLELARGYSVLGTEQSGTGRITGLKVGINSAGTEIAYATYARKVRYYTTIVADWTEVGADILPLAASGEDVTLDLFESRAGKQMWLNSPNTGPYKILLANPSTYVSMYDSTKNYKAWMRIFDNQAYIWNIDNSDKTAVRLSYIETRGLADYSVSTSEVFATGDGATKTFTRYLNFKTKATGTLTSDATSPSDGDTVTIDTTVYTFKTTLTPSAFQVLIGGSAANALTNLKKAINLTGVANTTYGAGTTVHPTVEATTLAATTLVLLAKTPGTAGNSIATTETSSHLSFAAVTLTTGATDKNHCLSVTVTDGTEAFTDNQDGTLTGSLGGTGTVNYITGQVSVTFNTAPTNATGITSTYSYVDETQTGGIANFVVPGSRVSGNPNVFRQDHGGNLETIVALKDHKFCLHQTATFDILPSKDDTATTNTLFREALGIKYLRGAFAAPEGIYVVDGRDPSNPRFGIVAYAAGSTDIKPKYISENLDLSGYTFDAITIFAFSDYILFGCRTNASASNNRTFVYHRIFKTWDLLDYYISCADIFEGTLIAGDSISNNVQRLFSGFDANGDVITNYWKSGVSKLGFINPRGKRYPIRALKRVKKVLLEGLIAPNQVLHMYAALDRGLLVEILDKDGEPFIRGSGPYVDKSQSVTIGSTVMGSKVIGGGGTGIEVYHYERQLPFLRDKFQDAQIMFQASDVGYVSIANCEFRDIRVLQDKPARKYRIR